MPEKAPTTAKFSFLSSLPPPTLEIVTDKTSHQPEKCQLKPTTPSRTKLITRPWGSRIFAGTALSLNTALPVTSDQADMWYTHRDRSSVHMLDIGRVRRGVPEVVIQKLSYSLPTCLQYNHNTYRDRITVPGRMHFPYFFHIHTYLLSAHVTVQPYIHIHTWLISTKNKYTRFISCRDHTKTW